MPKQAGKGNFRSIYCKLHDTPEFQELPWDAKGLFLILRGQQDTNMAGIFRYYMGPIRRRTAGLAEDARIAAFTELFQRGFVLYDKHTMWVVGALGNDPFITLTNPKHQTGVRSLLRALPPTLLIERFFRKYPEIRPDHDLKARMDEAKESAPPLGELGGEDEPVVIPTFTPSVGWLLAHKFTIGLLQNEPRRDVPSDLAEWAKLLDELVARGWTKADVLRGMQFALHNEHWKRIALDVPVLVKNWDKIVESSKLEKSSADMTKAKEADRAQERRARTRVGEARQPVHGSAGGTGLTRIEEILQRSAGPKQGDGDA